MNNEIQIMCTNIKKLRELNKLSQKEMARMLGIGIETLRSLENGIIPPRVSASLIIKISKLFNITPAYLFTDLEI